MKVEVDVNKEDLEYIITKYGFSDNKKAVERLFDWQIKESRSLDMPRKKKPWWKL